MKQNLKSSHPGRVLSCRLIFDCLFRRLGQSGPTNHSSRRLRRGFTHASGLKKTAVEPKNIGELVAVLKDIAQAAPLDKAELRQLENRCVALSLYLRKNRHLDFEIDEWVWHFLSDADIRFKDPRYAEQQLSAFRIQIVGMAARA